MRPRIIYILSLPHSGSTFLQYCLSNQPGILGLGEVEQLSRLKGWRDPSLPCSCGKPLGTCQLWTNLQPASQEDPLDWYRRLSRSVAENYPDFAYWVDSSKTWAGISPWLQLKKDDLIREIYILFLVRDARGWALSDQNTRRRKNYPSRPLYGALREWYKTHKLFLQLLSTHNIPHQVLSYEGLVFQNRKALTRIASFLDIQLHYGQQSSTFDNPVVHDVFGNRIKDDAVMRSQIIYDDGWLYSKPINLLAMTLFPLWSLNKKLHDLGI
jgi:hypothetical protein